jgi:hypothetical protein
MQRQKGAPGREGRGRLPELGLSLRTHFIHAFIQGRAQGSKHEPKSSQGKSKGGWVAERVPRWRVVFARTWGDG